MAKLRQRSTLAFPAGIVLAAAIVGCTGSDQAGEAPTKEEVAQRRKSKQEALNKMLNASGSETTSAEAKGRRAPSKVKAPAQPASDL